MEGGVENDENGNYCSNTLPAITQSSIKLLAIPQQTTNFVLIDYRLVRNQLLAIPQSTIKYFLISY